MKKVLLLLVLVWSCKKKDDPKPTPVPTPAPVVKHYEVNFSIKPAAYTQTASPFNAIDTRDSSYFTIKINNEIVLTDKQPKSTNNHVYKDSVKTGDQISIEVRMKTYTAHAKEAVMNLNKVWLMSPEVVLSSASSKTVPVTYSNGVGQANQSWGFTAP